MNFLLTFEIVRFKKMTLYIKKSELFVTCSKRSEILAITNKAVDRFHFKSHVGKECALIINSTTIQIYLCLVMI